MALDDQCFRMAQSLNSHHPNPSWAHLLGPYPGEIDHEISTIAAGYTGPNGK